MSSVTRVPETASMRDSELTLEDAWQTLRKHGGVELVKNAFVRFRYGDGFSHARALGLQIALAAVPLVIAFVGLSRTLDTSLGQVLRQTILSLAPAGSGGLLRDTLVRPSLVGEDRDELALWLGLLTAILALTTAMGQLERGANRIYGVRRDRPATHKYGHAVLMAVVAGIPAMVGAVLLLAVGTFGDAVEEAYGFDDDTVSAVGLPMGVVLVLGSLTVMMKISPRRRQPGLSWLVVGALIAVSLWLLFTALFAFYLRISNDFNAVYGPLTGIMALLLWGQLTAMSALFGLSFAAQLEAVRAGVRRAATGDPERSA